jgi:protein-S-isoprenylcysteine O-methyltransferase Ste14
MLGVSLVFIQFITIFLLFLSGPITPNNWLSGILFTLSLYIGLSALWTMRKSKIRILPYISKDAQLVTSGPYKIIRHPMYTAILLEGISMFLNDFSLLRLAIYLILLVTLLYKIEYEEKLLLKHFLEYRDYQQTTAKLIPFIY